MKRCIIVGAGDFFPSCAPAPRENDLIIAADGGYKYLKAMSIRPHLLIADFDSLTMQVENDIPVQRMKPEKDDTDMGLAISEGIRQGCTHFLLYGGTGGRSDHTFANYQALVSLARQGYHGFLFGNGSLTTAICNASLSLKAGSGFVSVFAADNQCRGVSIKGLKYTLDHISLTNDFPLGVSNELTGTPACISVEQGTLLIFAPADAVEY